MFDHISKHLEVRQKYSATRRIFNFLLDVWKCAQIRSFVFDLLPELSLKRALFVILDFPILPFVFVGDSIHLQLGVRFEYSL